MPPTSRTWQRALSLPVTILAWLAVLVIIGWLLSHIIRTLLVLTMGGIVALALMPLVGMLSRWLPRTLAIAAAYVLGMGAALGFGALLIVSTASQLTSLVDNLPTYSQRMQAIEPAVVGLLGSVGLTPEAFRATQEQALAQLQGLGTALVSQSLHLLTELVGTLVDAIVAVILSVYLAANGPRVGRWLQAAMPGRYRRHARLLVAVVHRVVGGYVRGMLTLATLIGVLVGGGLWVFGVPYALLLGLLAFLLEFIPVLGVLVSGVVCVLVALFQGWLPALLVLGYFVVIHIIEGDVVGPRIIGPAVGIHPATGLVALVAGTELFGVWGALFAAPVAGLLQAIGTAVWLEVRGGEPLAVLAAVVEQESEEAETRVRVTPDGEGDRANGRPVSS
jgi:predicted PurR-regulated permease PerM